MTIPEISQFRKVDLRLAPIEAAARMRAAGGLVFFDSAAPDAFSISIIAAAPSAVLRGTADVDWDRIRALLGCENRLHEGLAAGFVDYDGNFVFGLYANLFVYEHETRIWRAVGNPELPEHSLAPEALSPLRFETDTSCEAYCERVRRARDYIAAGDIYQVNLAHHFEAATEADPFAFYRLLRARSPSPYCAYLELAGRSVLSSSPESFLQMRGRHVRTRPIKGTRPRGRDAGSDDRLARELITSAKETAELVMITDLERNDLGRVCRFGTVRVAELLRLERYQQVFHLVSTVEGELRPEVDHAEALRQCFPGGSITGAPKRRAMEIIAELEPVPRGLYTGAIGWFGLGGVSQFNLAIRTVVMEEGRARFGVGAGIVADSDPAREYEETLHKAAGILLAATGH